MEIESWATIAWQLRAVTQVNTVVIMAPTLSIGLPCFNAGRFLLEAVQSILAQTHQDWELIAVDDGSSDGSFQQLKCIKDPRIRTYSDGVHRGLATRLNEIVGKARGNFIGRMDADDLSHPRRFEMQIKFLREHPEIDGVGCALVSFSRDYRAVGCRSFPTEMQSIVGDPLSGIRLAHATFCAHREWFEKHTYNENNSGCEDWELWQHSHGTSQFSNLSAPLYFYREFDSFSLPKYVNSKARITSLQWALRSQFGIRNTAKACARNALAAAVYSTATICGLTDRLIARRSNPASEEMQREFQQSLQQIRAQSVRSTGSSEINLGKIARSV